MATLAPIPQPPTVPFLANAPLLDRETPFKSFKQLAQQYGEIYQFKFPDGRTVLHVNSQPVLAQVSDDKRFKKVVSGPLEEFRNLSGDGLFTAHLEEPNWGKAHRILMPAFSAAAVRNMFDGMKDICSQLILKWQRFGSDHEIDPADDFTRLTFDTIGFCSMSYRFNSFYERNMPKFIQEMVDVLIESMSRAFRGPFSKALPLLNRTADAKYFAAIKDMMDTASDIVKKRRAKPQANKDVLTMMLEGKDPQTGEGLSDESIMYNLLTFLIAGHETTSGMLTFTTYHLLKNPDTLIKLRQEIDSVVGTEEIRLEHLDQMPYLTAVMRESLRLSPTATARTVAAREDTFLIGGDGDEINPANKKYEIKKDAPIIVHVSETQIDPRAWGEDAQLFRPERMLDGKFDAAPYQAWQPFGFGMRGCIGRLFALQEAQLVLATVFQKFDLTLADPSYSLEIKQTMTIKPKNLRIHAKLRSQASFTSFPNPPSARASTAPSSEGSTGATAPAAIGSGPLYIFYGSNTGSSESFAGRIASDASSHGFAAKIAILDSATGHLPIDGPVVIVTASFEGEPADNASQFVSWIQSLPANGAEGPLKGVNFAMFGCGNREWARTYQRIPILCDQTLEKNGAFRVMDRGEGDAAAASFFQAFDEWEAKLWIKLAEKYGSSTGASVKPSAIPTDTFLVDLIDAGTGRAKMLRQQDAAMGTVLENRRLTKEGVPEKRHIQIKLPDEMTYRAGDYLAILPTNPSEVVDRVLQHFKLAADKEIVIKSDGPTSLPSGYPVPCKELLGGYVELTQPATSRDIAALEAYTESEATTSVLKGLQDDFESTMAKRISIIDIVESHGDIQLPFSQYLRMLPPMRVRQYSISSSALVYPDQASLTISVLDAPARSGLGKRYLGIASNFLAHLAPGDKIPVVVRTSSAAFHLPRDPLVPVIMSCAGSGLAPFRGFIQERAAQKAAGREIGKTILFFGCRLPDEDYLYSDSDLRKWQEEGVADVRPAFSRKQGASEGCKYAQDRIWNDREEIIKLFNEGARFYTCGSRNLSNGVKKTYLDVVKHGSPGIDEQAAEERLAKIQKERFAMDIFD